MTFPYNEPVNSQYGAPMGRRDVRGDPKRLTLRPVPMHDGAYDGGGAYWGTGTQLWCAWDAKRETVRYLRARSQGAAMLELWDDYPGIAINGYKQSHLPPVTAVGA